MDPLKIFVSHSSKYVELAKSLKRSLEALESVVRLDIKVSAEMAGATNWREWIEDNVCSANVFLLLYPHANMEMGWCNYELGRFYERRGHIACIKNVDIAKPPPAFEPYQAYTGNEQELLKFLNELFVAGAFTSGAVLNAEVGQMASDYFARARNVARELAQKFAEARVREQLYERRIVMSLRYANQAFDPAGTTIEGNYEGLNLLGLRNEANVPWANVRASLGDDPEWPADLERALSAIAGGELPPSLSPFRVGSELYIPVVTRAESVDDVLRQVVIIFVAADGEKLRPLLDWTTPPAMPDQFAALIRLVRMMLRVRWDILEPNYQKVKYRSRAKEPCATVVAAVLDAFDRMRREAERQGVIGIAKFFSVFDVSLRPEVEEVSREYSEAMRALEASATATDQEIEDRLKRLLDNNARWLQIAGRQFSLAVEAMP